MKFIFSLIVILFLSHAFGQDIEGMKVGGVIVDAQTKTPLEFCTVKLLSKIDSSFINGTTSNTNGNFELNISNNKVMLKISFIGYTDYYLSDFSLFKDETVDTIYLKLNAELLNNVEVIGERSEMTFKLDKRIFNVGRDLSQSGGTAIDILNNVPSVEVTLEGVVQLRGNSGVQILINGKPSVLASGSSNALGSITADMIDRIEVITSPSAKYDAEGTVGIINIVLKETQKKGLNGSITANVGYPNNHSLGVSASYRSEKINLFGQLGIGNRRFVSIDTSVNRSINDDLTNVFSTYGNSQKNETFANVRLGSDFYLNEFNTITLSGHYAYELEAEYADIQYFSNTNDVLESNFLRNESTDATNPKYQFDLNYQKKFQRHKEQVLDISAVGSFFGKDKMSEFDNVLIAGEDIGFDQQTQINFKDQNYTFKIDYAHPFKEKWVWEIGSKYEVNFNSNLTEVSNFKDEAWQHDTLLSGDFNYQLGVFANYSTLSYEGDKWGMKGGVRHEQTDAKANQAEQELGQWNYTNFFPSLHTSYKVSKFTSFQLGYSRRINRPHLFDFSPFFSFRDNFNLSVGNPELQPEFSNLFELTAVQNWKKTSLNASLYHSQTTDVIEDVVSITGNQTIRFPENIGTANTSGLELNLKYSPQKWVSILIDGNVAYFNRKGTYENQSFDFNNYKWSSRANLKFKMPADIEMQFSLNYRSRVQNVFTERRGYFYVDSGIRKKIMKGKFILNLSVRDVFNSRINKNYTVRTNSSLYSRSQRGRYIVFGVSYNFGKGEAMEFSGQKMF